MQLELAHKTVTTASIHPCYPNTGAVGMPVGMPVGIRFTEYVEFNSDRSCMNDNVSIAAALAIQTAKAHTIQLALQAVLKELGRENIEGQPISEWFDRKEAETLQALLIRMEDMNPAVAAKVQQHLDKLV